MNIAKFFKNEILETKVDIIKFIDKIIKFIYNNYVFNCKKIKFSFIKKFSNNEFHNELAFDADLYYKLSDKNKKIYDAELIKARNYMHNKTL